MNAATIAVDGTSGGATQVPVLDPVYQLQLGHGPVVAVAIHSGHDVRDEMAKLLAIDDRVRLRAEDPFTDRWTSVAPTRVVGLRSRFEVDLDQSPDKAVYVKPEDAWGLSVWKHELPQELIDRSLEHYDQFYQMMRQLLREVQRQFHRFLVIDLHSCCPEAVPEHDTAQVKVLTIPNPNRWHPVIERFVSNLRAFEFQGGPLDVRKDVKTSAGGFAQWVQAAFPKSACVLSLRFQRFFMDEATGEPHEDLIASIRDALKFAISGTLEELRRT